jgi:hypothetical protein
LVPTGLCNLPHCKGINGLPQTTVPGWLISRYGDLPWPPRSPDLTAPDFFMGLPEGKGISNKAQELKDSIHREILSIQQETLTSVMDSVVWRVQHCVALRGSHLPQVIFRT